MSAPKLLISAAALAVGACTVEGREASPDPLRLRVLTYNIHHGEGVDARFDLERLAAVIRDVDPDVVALQEVDRGTTRAAGVDQPAELGRLTGLTALFGKAMDFAGGGYGEAVLSRWTPAAVHGHALPHEAHHEPRAALAVRLQPSDRAPAFTFVGTHLDHTRDPADRIAQARRLVELFARDPAAPAILAGDLNAVPDSGPMAPLLERFADAAADAPGPTFPSDQPRRRIDYVLLWPPARWRVVETRVLDEPIASDHAPLLAVVELLPARDPLRDAGDVELVRDGFGFLEGPAWSASQGSLLFTDIPNDRIHRLDADGTIAVFREPSHHANGLIFDPYGGLIACEHGARRVSLTPRGAATRALAATFDERRLNSPNDAVLRSDGNLYFTDPEYGLDGRPREQDGDHVFRLAPDGALSIAFCGDDRSRPNGIQLSIDERTLYVADTSSGAVRAYEVRPDGSVGAGREFAKTAGEPDGMAIDRDGNLYVTSAAGVEVFAPDGRRWGALAIPQQPSNCAFGGADALTLYVTAHTALYRVRLAIPGRY